MRVAALAGGTGGAKLAAGIQEIAGEELTVDYRSVEGTRSTPS